MVPLVDQSTVRTRPQGIARIHQDHGDARERRCVHDELPPWRERPTVLATLLRASNRDPVADARQLFHDNPVPPVLVFRHQLIGHAGVLVRGNPLFFTTAFLE